MIKNMLKGHDTLEASNGKEGLELLGSNGDIDIILSDVNMPDMDGMQMVETIRQGEHASMPVVFLTSERDKELIARAEAAGVKDWLPKPFKKDQLLEVVSKLTA